VDRQCSRKSPSVDHKKGQPTRPAPLFMSRSGQPQLLSRLLRIGQLSKICHLVVQSHMYTLFVPVSNIPHTWLSTAQECFGMVRIAIWKADERRGFLEQKSSSFSSETTDRRGAQKTVWISAIYSRQSKNQSFMVGCATSKTRKVVSQHTSS
jgi:hypothetical protein